MRSSPLLREDWQVTFAELWEEESPRRPIITERFGGDGNGEGKGTEEHGKAVRRMECWTGLQAGNVSLDQV